MKKIYLALLLLLGSYRLFAQTNISFNLSEKVVSVGGRPNIDDPIKIALSKGEYLVLDIKNTGNKPYKVLFTSNGKTDSLSNSDLSNDKIIIDTALVYQRIHLNKNFRIIIKQTGNHLTKFVEITAKNRKKTQKSPKKTVKELPLAAKATIDSDSKKNLPYQLGFPYYDAITIINYKSVRATLIDSILATYTPSGNIGSEIKTMLNDNPFFANSKIKNSLMRSF